MGNHDEFDLDVRLTSGRSTWASRTNFAEEAPEKLTIHQQTCEGCAPTGIGPTCADSCDDACDTQQTQCNQNTCQQTCAGQNTCPATQCDITCQTGCGTCQTQCNPDGCLTLNTCVGNTCEFCTVGNCP